ncbi:thiamine-monophosphate kinase [Telmatocola sphagniphila]|uniref:Thiamine-monophosphate kinase n=1 Tax=Telmatocola sphagniphila TaxID=1123043 RepID=A0A8E6BAK5_9BACT|nr:thiamine-phosphate kinase [Telmatocola sphagniphila]QVL34314.1 thiamine-monophosphate kinase [Telmatocola sphagniphila]
MHEFGFIDWLRKRQTPGHQTTIGIGDDTAGFRFSPGCDALITTDMLLEGSCFLLAEAGAEAVGRKALAVNLSDIAAMAGIPKAALISLALPRKKGAEIAQGLFRGIESLARDYEVEIIGGDTNSWNGPLSISITLFGESTAKGPVKRSGAEIGDVIFVTGPLGGSILGRHLNFEPRVREALQLHRAFDLHSMIDLSDGLSRDLGHICEESHCGAEIWARELPITPAAQQLSRQDGRTPEYHALHDGEDFELCFTVSESVAEQIRKDPMWNCTAIGRIQKAEQGIRLLDENNQWQPLEAQGYQHEFD